MLQEPLRSFLSAFDSALKHSVLPDEPDPSLSVRASAVCALLELPAYQGFLEREACFYERFLNADPVCFALSGQEDFPVNPCTGLKEDILYLWRGTPFARENTHLILEPVHADGEEYAIRVLDSECRTLAGISDDYRDLLVKNLSGLLERFPDAIPACRQALTVLRDESEKPLSDLTPELKWPWDPLSPSIRTLMQECLGEQMSEGVLNPFSERIIVFPARSGELIGDSLWSSMCSVNPYFSGASDSPDSPAVSADAVLPPLSESFARSLLLYPEVRVLLTPDFLSFSRPNESALEVVITLNGTFPLRLIRSYSAEEILNLYSHDIPTIALWPSIPFRPEDWRAYFVYAHLPEGCDVSVLRRDGVTVQVVGEGARRTIQLDDFPGCFLLRWNSIPAGALLNLLPGPQIEPSGGLTACVDFGSVATSVILSWRSGRKPLQGPVMIRQILSHPAVSPDLLRKEFLPAVPVSALLPTVSRLFRNVPGSDPEPFSDGIVLMTADMRDILSIPDQAVYTCLKWEDIKGRSGFVCLHQIMLMTALQARYEGATQLSWRFALPDEMAQEGRDSLFRLFTGLTDLVLQESGFPCQGGMLPVSFASESSALGAYFRLCAGEDTRGGFMVLDLGATTADISLFLRGREAAVRTCQLPLGVHYMLLPTLLKDPDMLSREFSFLPDESFQSDMNLLIEAKRAAKTDPVSLRKARLALDHFLTDRTPELVSAVLQLTSSGYYSRIAAVVLLHLSYLMILPGLVLLQIAADPNKNDFLPEQMSLCLAGRGSFLLEAMPDPVKASLWHFLTMFRNRRVASLSMLFSAEKKMEIPVGLSVLQNVSSGMPAASSVPASIAVRPEELLPEFLLRFRREFPASAEALFSGCFSDDFYHPFSPRGESIMTASIDQSFTVQENPRPYDLLASWIGTLLDCIP